MKTINLCDHST